MNPVSTLFYSVNAISFCAPDHGLDLAAAKALGLSFSVARQAACLGKDEAL
jgi:hypothetical protein